MTLPRRFHAAVIAVAATAAVSAVAAPAASASAQSHEPPPGCTGPASPFWLNVVASGLRNSDGLLAITLYADNSSKFLAKKGSIYVGRMPVMAGTTRGCIFVPRPGVYALAVYHDENASQRFDRTGIGFPAEGFAFSNNPPTLAGLPSFRSVRLNVPRSGLTTRVTMKYP